MKEEEQDKKQRKRLVHASLFSGFGAPDGCRMNGMAECLPL